MPRYHQYSAWAIYAFICGLFLFLAVRMPVAYIWTTYEDLYGEWLQMWLFVSVCVLGAMNARRGSHYRWFFVLLSLAGFYTVMEEISWGQRLFAFDSPEFFQKFNIQGETNIHNLLTGPQSTVLSDVITNALAAALFVYGLIYPLLLSWRLGIARWLSDIGIAPPPLYLWMFFVTAAGLELGLLRFNEAEVAEILVGTALLIMLLHYIYIGEAPEGGAGIPGHASSSSCARTAVFVLALLVVLAIMTTRAIYSSPELHERVNNRVLNGFEKYAGRFENLHMWSQAAEFYRRIYEARPDDQGALRAAIRNYKAADQVFLYRKYYRILLDETVTAEVKANTSIESQLLLAHSYAEIGETEISQQFLDRALLIATERVAKYPDNSDNYYWLGRAKQERADYQGALDAYRQAAGMAPGINRYSRAVRILESFLATRKPAG